MGDMGEGGLCGSVGPDDLIGWRVVFEVWTDHKNLEALQIP